MDAVATNILLEKRARKMAEDDALRLYNRVRQLQKEEDKALKRIQDTKRKAKEIVRLRERNELQRQEKEQRYRELQIEIERQKQTNLQLKEEILRNKTEQENKIWADKVTTVQQSKEEKAEFEKMLAESKLLSRKEALEQKEAVRKAQEEARRKIETLKIQKLQMVGHAFVCRMCMLHASHASMCPSGLPAQCWSGLLIAAGMLSSAYACCCRHKMSMSGGSGRRWRPRQQRRQKSRSW